MARTAHPTKVIEGAAKRGGGGSGKTLDIARASTPCDVPAAAGREELVKKGGGEVSDATAWTTLTEDPAVDAPAAQDGTATEPFVLT